MRRLVDPVLDRRLNTAANAPLAVALSGGGDSLALLILTLDWARRHGRNVHALVFDHALHPDSAGWTSFALEAARRLGATAVALRWEGEKPATGLPAAARAARHAALAERARERGARVLLMGHTADDRMEAAVMRAGGASVSEPREWSPSPAWPQGRELFVLRPLLDIRRADLRQFLRARGEAWLDDPANDNPRFARTRARRAIGPDKNAPPARGRAAPPSIAGWREVCGALVAEGAVDPGTIAPAMLSAGGGTRPPSRERLERLKTRLAAPGDFTATLAQARLARRGDRLTVTRETGRTPAGAAFLAAGAVQVFDGRFEISSPTAAELRPLGGLARRLPAEQQARLREVPAPGRPSLPALVDAAGVNCPILAGGSSGAVAASLVMARFAAACGQTTSEAI